MGNPPRSAKTTCASVTVSQRQITRPRAGSWAMSASRSPAESSAAGGNSRPPRLEIPAKRGLQARLPQQRQHLPGDSGGGGKPRGTDARGMDQVRQARGGADHEISTGYRPHAGKIGDGMRLQARQQPGSAGPDPRQARGGGGGILPVLHPIRSGPQQQVTVHRRGKRGFPSPAARGVMNSTCPAGRIPPVRRWVFPPPRFNGDPTSRAAISPACTPAAFTTNRARDPPRSPSGKSLPRRG